MLRHSEITPTPPSSSEPIPPLALLAAYAASTVTRNASRLAFEKYGRAMQTSDVMLEVGRSFEQVLGEDNGKDEESPLARKEAML